MKKLVVILLMLVAACGGANVPPYLGPDSGPDANQRVNPDGGSDLTGADARGEAQGRHDSAWTLDAPEADAANSERPAMWDAQIPEADASDRESIDATPVLDSRGAERPDVNADGLANGADGMEAGVPEPARYHLMVADYDNNLGQLNKDGAGSCARRPPASLVGKCLQPGQNNLGQCAASAFCDPAVAGRPTTSGGSLCLTYVDEASEILRGKGRSLRLDFDVTGSSEAYAGYVESLVSNTPRCPAKGSFNVAGLGFTHLSFWYRDRTADGSKAIEMEMALKDADGVQTSRLGEGKRRLSDFQACETVGEWKKHCIKLEELAGATTVSPDGGVVDGEVDLQHLAEINFAFSMALSDHGDTSRAGTVWLDEIAFERRE